MIVSEPRRLMEREAIVSLYIRRKSSALAMTAGQEGKLILSLAPSTSRQEEYYAYATLTIKPEELQQNLKKHHKIDWGPV
ncbi:hypothetical protein CYLTODRAFT_460117 [Cylindrobasidium torrendii FP15055 ss-10]|uniref:Uncharacterized protein n=1 Tax=Cylindrobasidium torrendii FP15055 ss-10 TaxID=1314674 RepID=A0A0D7AV02_9AGAR|nr:hypothetical protein CYLTODRAFT_460117 [Cylindrobasidium torrendii FP15055 ss-10]